MKLRTKILIGLIAVVLLGWFFLMPSGRYRRAAEAYKKELLAKGEKLTIGELIPPVSSKDINGAAKFLAISNVTQRYWGLPVMRYVAPGAAEVGHLNLTPMETAEYEVYAPEALKLWAALEATVLDFNLDYTNMAHWDSSTVANHISGMKYREQLASYTAVLALNRQDAAEAALNMNAAVDIVRLYNREAMIISDLVRAACARIAVGATWEGVQSDLLTESQLAGLQTNWESLDLFDTAESSLKMEMASRIESTEWFRKTPNLNFLLPPGWVPLVLTNSAGNKAASGGLAAGLKRSVMRLYYRYPRYWAWKSSWSFEEEQCALQFYDAVLEAVRHTRTTGSFAPALKEFDRTAINLTNLYRNSDAHFLNFSVIDGKGLRSYLIRIVQAETARRLTITAIALKRYHLQRNAYPASLNDLVPAFLSQVPNDLMDGKPLRYQLKPEGDFLLYSVGEDGADDGGDPTPVSGPNDLARGRDMVWPRAATTHEVVDYVKTEHPLSGPMTSETVRELLGK